MGEDTVAGSLITSADNPRGQIDPTVQHNFDATDIFSVNSYTFMDHAYGGTGGFRTGKYLVPHDREVFFDKRRQVSFYKNFVQPIVDAMIDPVFNEIVSRSVAVGGSEVMGQAVNLFLEDVDGGGTHIQEFAKEAVFYARLHGVAFIIMENFPAEQQPPDVRAALEGRIYPYVYLKKANEVVDYRMGDFGNLETIVFEEVAEVGVNAETRKPIKKIRRREWTEDIITVFEKNDDNDWVPVWQAANTLGIIPIIPVFNKEANRKKTMQPDPPLYDVAKLNHAIYNKDSEIRSQERSQAFAIFYIPDSGESGNITIGDKTVLWVTTESSFPPGFASPDPNVLKGLVENNKALEDALYQIAEQSGVKGVQSAKSGVAIQWEFFAHESVLKKTSRIAVTAEQRMIDLFGEYIGASYEYTVDYPDDFQPANQTEETNLIVSTLDIGYPPRATAMLKAKAFRGVMADQDQEEVKLAIGEILQEAEDKTQAGAIGASQEQVSLAGIQIKSILDIAAQVSQGTLSAEAGISLITSTLPVTPDAARQIVSGVSSTGGTNAVPNVPMVQGEAGREVREMPGSEAAE